jgi:hypothetical protein
MKKTRGRKSGDTVSEKWLPREKVRTHKICIRVRAARYLPIMLMHAQPVPAISCAQ